MPSFLRDQPLTLLVSALGVVVLAFLWAGCNRGEGGAISREEAAGLAYVGRGVCAECHAEETALFKGSYHDLAMDFATPETVLGDFNDAAFTHFGMTTRFFREGDRYFTYTEGPGGEMDTFLVKYTFGVYPLQQYMVEFPDGRVQNLTIAWDSSKNRWFSLYPDERHAPDDWLHWTNAGMNWNYMCAECHSTDLEKNFDLATNTYHTTWFEIDVSCESCHGPGERHVELARRDDYDPKRSGLIVNLSGVENQRTQIETCAPCHSRRREIDPDFLPGDAYLDHYAVELLDENLYYPDGQILDEVYVYGSFTQSKMYHNGVRCSDCHDPHSTKIKLQGNALCLQCHAPALYDGPIHHHHPDTSQAGSQCVDCHMPERPYMVVDPRRDHSFHLPRPDLSVDLGIPNVCNRCHTDQTPEWARDKVIEWYGPNRRNEPHFARAFVAGRKREPGGIAALSVVVGDTSRAAIVRATAVSILAGYGTPEAVAACRPALRDLQPLVRSAAVRCVESLPDDPLYENVTPLLTDETRLVRTEAARVLSRLGRERFGSTPGTDRAGSFRSALDEYIRSQEAVNDQAAAHLNIAVIHENLGEIDQAEGRYETALRLDSSFVPARINLAMLYDRRRQTAMQTGQTATAERLRTLAERQLTQAVRFEPDLAEAHYLLGLLLAEHPGRLAEAAERLAEAARLSPANARMQYNAGLAYQQLENRSQAERFLLAAHRLESRQPDYLNALSVLYIQMQRWPDALKYAEMLAEQFPGSPDVQQRLAYIRGQIG